MDENAARQLIALNNEFYRVNAASFSATRKTAWRGWGRVMDDLAAPPHAVLDVACGNMRFKRYLDERLDNDSFEYRALDSCSAFEASAPDVPFVEIDILEALLKGESVAASVGRQYDLVACFGFMHHVPGADLRFALMDDLVKLAAKNATVAVSFWQFARDPLFAAKARKASEAEGDRGYALEEGDYLIGWDGGSSTLRYCHSFSDSEIDALADLCKSRAVVVDRFRSDGRTGEMNGYLVLRRR